MKDHITKLDGIVSDIYGADELSSQLGEKVAKQQPNTLQVTSSSGFHPGVTDLSARVRGWKHKRSRGSVTCLGGLDTTKLLTFPGVLPPPKCGSDTKT